MDTILLKEQISETIQDILVGLWWKMINMGTQGAIKLDDQMQTLHIYVDELDAKMAKPLLMELYESWPSANYVFPFMCICNWFWRLIWC